jgi:hypothetical protein
MSFVDNNALISDLQRDHEINNPKRKFNNCATLKPNFEKGASGCLIIDEGNNIKGLLIGGCPLPNYNDTYIVKSKYCSKMIKRKKK